MFDIQGIAEKDTVQRFAEVLKIPEDTSRKIIWLIATCFEALSENLGLGLPSIEPKVFLEILLDQIEGKERPIIFEDLDRLFPGLSTIMKERS